MINQAMLWWTRAMVESGAIIGDTETTGFGAKDRVIDLGLVDAGTGAYLFHTLINTSAEINPKAQAIHNITKEQLAGKPDIVKIWPSVESIIGNRPVIFFNASFDERMIKQTLEEAGLSWRPSIYCLMKAYQLYGSFEKPPSLSTACVQLGIEPGTHRALSDARAAAGVFKAMQLGVIPDYDFEGRPSSSSINPLDENFNETNPNWRDEYKKEGRFI